MMDHIVPVPFDIEAAPADDFDPIEFICAADLHQIPIVPRKWHVPDLIPAGAVTMLSGDGGVGKSLLALQLAVATVLGRDWIGRVTNKGSVLFFSAEDEQHELHRRLFDIAKYYATDLSGLNGLTLLDVVGKDALLSVVGGTGRSMVKTALFTKIEGWIAENKPALVVLDTLSDVFGGDEINRSHARQFIGHLRSLCTEYRTTILILSHPSQAGKTRGDGLSGSTAWNNSVRSRLYLTSSKTDEESGDRDFRILEGMKSNYGPRGTQMHLGYREGVFHYEGSHVTQGGTKNVQKAERVFMTLLRDYHQKGRRVNSSGSSTYAPTVFASDPRNEGVSKKALVIAMNSLLARGLLKISKEGPRSRTVTFLVPADE